MTKKNAFFYTFLYWGRYQIRIFAFPQKQNAMVTELLVVWVLGVVAFFVLWAILLKVIKRVSERKKPKEENVQEEVTKRDDSVEQPI
ncbi:MAG: hypothetical protein IJP44_09950 [Bacteroidales bacterium]|nr:hypothetical protein [Bacteroidales bacterium]